MLRGVLRGSSLFLRIAPMKRAWEQLTRIPCWFSSGISPSQRQSSPLQSPTTLSPRLHAAKFKADRGFRNEALAKLAHAARIIICRERAGAHDVFGAENLGGHAFVINALGLAHRFLGQIARGEKLHRESTHQRMFPFDLPSVCLEVRVNCGNAGSQAFVLPWLSPPSCVSRRGSNSSDP
jgi:hypothetical protein